MEQQEQVEWDDVNKLLQHHGFKPVFFADPVENSNLTDLVLLDKKSVNELRKTLRMMLTDSERRQVLIQELVRSNNQLKEEVQKHMSRAAQQSERAAELQDLLDEVRRRVQDLEERCLGKALQQHRHAQRLQTDNTQAQRRCVLLEQKLAKLEDEAAQLRRKLYFTVKEQEQQLSRHGRGSQRVKQRSSTSLPRSYKTIVTDQQAGSGARIQELQEEVELLRKELDARDQSRNTRPGLQNHHKLRSPTRHTLASIVSHFQKLFDAPTLSGVYPRMNEVYTRLGEMTNALRNLRNLLDLDSKASPTEVVNQVSRLVSLDPGLGGADIDSIIVKVKQHDEFFPAFHNLVTEILKILGVGRLDDILPALESLKQTA